MLKLSDRKKKILTAIIEDYSRNAEPISSRCLSKRRGLKVSPATIRNEMADLEDAGYIMQPHTSAGRIPSDKGYRYYVDELMRAKSLSQKEIEFIKEHYKKIGNDVEDIIMETLKILSSLSHYATVAVTPRIFRSGSGAKSYSRERVYSDGITNILRFPEFNEVSHAYSLLELLEQKDTLAEILKEYATPNEISIKIGKENRLKGLKEMSVITTTYEYHESFSGTIGLIGPTRMFYDRASAVVSSVAENLSSLFSEEV